MQMANSVRGLVVVAAALTQTACVHLDKRTALEMKVAATSPVQNLCIGGRMAPELILLGAARCSTSSFAQNIYQSPSIKFPTCLPEDNRPYKCPAHGLKEMHFFNHDERYSLGTDFWLNHYPECQTEDRFVATDLTPAYLADPKVPDRLLEFYGKKISAVKFLVLVRDPIKVIQSFFYYEHAEKKHSFQNWVSSAVKSENARGRHFKNAMYAPQLELYFRKFNASQFIIVPMKYNVASKDGHPAFVDHLRNYMSLKAPPPDVQPIGEWNTHEHPSVEEDLDKDTFKDLQELVEELTGPRVLALVLSGSGANLYGYEGAPSDIDAIAKWISDGW